jgi:hypothetical protein
MMLGNLLGRAEIDVVVRDSRHVLSGLIHAMRMKLAV